ncbi:hypothetical protein [Chitinophaga vietnamensis]|uniref:hypothetical protein n=1 Tax=Chitinophaga vietnamensis TaxID=2593957 RepID=UPI0011780F52|nr:hypothetical protein [Chitinophaga vietnamensis]
MSDLSSAFMIDPAVLHRLVQAYTSYAAYLQSGNSADTGKIAACFMHAASYQLLLDQAASKRLFSRAAQYYAQANLPYGVIASICCDEISYLGYVEYKEKRNTAPDLQFYQLLNMYFVGESVITSARQEPVGKLQLPFSLYADTLEQTADFSWEQKAGQLPKAWTPLLSSIYSHLQTLQSNTEQWRQLQGTPVPVEPETLATCITLLKITDRNGIPREVVQALIKQQKSAAFLPLKIALLL